MRRILTAVLSLTFTASGLGAQPADTVARLDSMMRLLVRADTGGIWPGFRADTIAVAFVLPTHGTILFEANDHCGEGGAG